MKPHIRILVLAFALLGAIGIAYGLNILEYRQNEGSARNLPGTVTTGEIQIGGAFAMVNQNGETVTEKSWPNQYRLIFFGFTHCPDVCPTELGKMTQALNLMGKNADKLQPIFVSLDPGRDTPAALKEYVALFNPKLVGLTGTPEQVETIRKAYRVYAAKVGDGDDYMVDHSAFIYLMAPNGDFIDVFQPDDSAEDMAKRLALLIK